MELRQLETFLAVADARSFTRAAERLGTTQSAVSATVRRLEADLGTPLFDRTTHRVDLTDAGTALVPEARRTLAAAATAREAVDEVRGGLRGSVRLGVMQAQATGTVSAAACLAAFRQAHPRVRVELRQAGSAYLGDQVVSGELDLALVGIPGTAPPGLTLTELAREPIACACAAGHPFAGRRSVTLAEVAAVAGADLPPRWSLRTANDSSFAAAGLERRLEYEVNDSSSIVDLVRHGLAVALVPASLLAPGDPTVVTVPVAGLRQVHRIALASPSTRPLGRAAQALHAVFLAHRPAGAVPGPAPA